MLKKSLLALLGGTFLVTVVEGSEAPMADLGSRHEGGQVKEENSAGEEPTIKEEIESLAEALKLLTGRVEILEHQKKVLEKQVASSQFSPVEPVTVPGASENKPLMPATEVVSVADEEQDEAQVEAVLESLGAASEKPAPSKQTVVAGKRDQATQKAEQTATSVLEVGSPAAQFNQAKGLLNKKQYPEAEAAFKHYVSLYPDSKETPFARLHIGEAQIKQGNFEEAKATFAKAYQAHSTGTAGAQALLGLGSSLATQDPKKACIVLKKLKTDFPDNKETIEQTNELLKTLHCAKKD